MKTSKLMRAITRTLIPLVASLFVVNLSLAQTGNKVVVIPLSGDDIEVPSGIEYTAGSGISITTPDPENPNQQVISFDPTRVNLTATGDVDVRDPYLGLNYIIALQGTFPSRNSITDPTLAEISLFGGNFAPRSWAYCSGQLLAISQNTALFSLLGTTYGGDGRTTFGLPDLRGRVAVGSNGNSAGPGLPAVRLGERGGARLQTLQLQVQ